MSLVFFSVALVLCSRAAAEGPIDTFAESSSTQEQTAVQLENVAKEALYEGIVTLTVLGVVFGAGSILQGFGGKKGGKAARKGRKVSKTDCIEVPPPSLSIKSKKLADQAASDDSPRSSLSSVSTATSARPAPARKSQAKSFAKAANATSQWDDTTDMLAAAVRAGQVQEAIDLLVAACDSLPSDRKAVASDYLLSTAKACASRRHFHEALGAFDSVVSHIEQGKPALWSVLLYCAAEAEEYQRCPVFFQRMQELGATLSGHDFVNMVRYYVYTNDAASIASLRSLAGSELDDMTRNRSLAACAAAGAQECAEALACAGPGKPLDEVAYNTLIKCYMNAGQLDRCLQLQEDMQKKGIKPSAVTFGILLDACISMQDFESAAAVFSRLQNSGLTMNTVLYTTYIKGLIKAGHIDRAREAFGQMRQSRDAAPDLVTYSTLLKAHSDRGEVSCALEVLDDMRAQGIKPDLIAFNIVLSGSCNASDPTKPLEILDMLECERLVPSKGTLSMLVKALSKHRQWKKAADTLESCPRRFKISPDHVHFLHLAQAASKVGDSSAATYIYDALTRTAQACGDAVAPSTRERIHQLCVAPGKDHGGRFASVSGCRSFSKPGCSFAVHGGASLTNRASRRSSTGPFGAVGGEELGSGSEIRRRSY